MEAGHPERAIEENQQELAAYMSTEGSNDITANAALWAYHTIRGFCHVWVETSVSREIAADRRYIAAKLFSVLKVPKIKPLSPPPAETNTMSLRILEFQNRVAPRPYSQWKLDPRWAGFFKDFRAACPCSGAQRRCQDLQSVETRSAVGRLLQGFP